MRFGEYVRNRRKHLQLRQQDFKEFDQSYISRIEKGEYNPTKRETIEQLATALQIPHEKRDWFWVYSLLDKDPHDCFGRSTQEFGQPAALPEHATPPPHSQRITIGMTAAAVQRLLGTPDVTIESDPPKWIYWKAEVMLVLDSSGNVLRMVDLPPSPGQK